jgi:hypothetical protein
MWQVPVEVIREIIVEKIVERPVEYTKVAPSRRCLLSMCLHARVYRDSQVRSVSQHDRRRHRHFVGVHLRALCLLI